MKCGDVVLLDHPYADGTGSKVRPVLIVHSDRDNQRLTNTIVALSTKNVSRVHEATRLRSSHRHRRYQVTVGRDLLDDWTVAIRYGRRGRELRYAASEADASRAIIRDRLRRRLSAPRRIGCFYRPASFSAARGFDASSWLPGKVMARFFQTA